MLLKWKIKELKVDAKFCKSNIYCWCFAKNWKVKLNDQSYSILYLKLNANGTKSTRVN